VQFLHRQLKQYHVDLTNNYRTAQYATSDTWQITLLTGKDTLKIEMQ
jgi:hypothetical protein